jgi:hypothetical protein
MRACRALAFKLQNRGIQYSTCSSTTYFCHLSGTYFLFVEKSTPIKVSLVGRFDVVCFYGTFPIFETFSATVSKYVLDILRICVSFHLGSHREKVDIFDAFIEGARRFDFRGVPFLFEAYGRNRFLMQVPDLI